MAKKKTFEVVYEDDYLIIVNKASGIPVIPQRTSEMGQSLKYVMKEKFEDIYIVHRIDQETSGLVIFAKDADTHRMLNTMFANRKIRKKYLLLTRGIPPHDNGKIDLALKKLNNKNKSVAHKDGKEALSTYSVLEKFRNIALVEAEIHTGRHHQIRVHFKSINYPLLVDSIYGDEGFYLSEIKARKFKKGKYEVELPLMSRLSLHAHRIEFQHPRTQQEIKVEAEIPKDFRACLNQLRKN